MRRLLSLVLIAAGLAAPGRASAQNKAAADAVFKEGRRLLAKGDVTAACAKFEGSLKLMEQLGVRLNLADCYERLGKLSAAYAEFRTAEIAATRAGDRRAQFAGDRLAALEKRMPYLSVGLASGAAITGLVVERDGQPLDPSLLDTALPIDPGEHEVTARAPGRLPWSFRIEAVEGARSTVEVPLLQPEPRPAAPAQAGKPVAATRPVPPREEPMPTTIPPAPEPSDERKPGRTARAWGTLLTVAGAGALVTCLVFGSQAESRWSEAEASG